MSKYAVTESRNLVDRRETTFGLVIWFGAFTAESILVFPYGDDTVPSPY